MVGEVVGVAADVVTEVGFGWLPTLQALLLSFHTQSAVAVVVMGMTLNHGPTAL